MRRIRGSVPRWGPPIAVILVAGVIGLLRVPSPARHKIWAEDGLVFLSGSLRGASPLAPYDGYLHLVPRLLARLLTTFVEPGSYDVALRIVSLGVTAVVCGLTFVLTRDLLTTVWARTAVSLAPVVLPVMALESLGNLANLHTFGLWLVPWMLLHRPTTRAAAAAWAVVALLIGFTEILTVLFFPLMLVGWRHRLGWPVRIAFLAAAAAQALTALTHPRTASTRSPVDWWDVVGGYVGSTGGGLFEGTGQAPAHLVDMLGDLGIFLLLIPTVLAMIAVVRWGTPQHRVVAAALLGGSVLLWTASLAVNFQTWMTFSEFAPERWDDGLVRYAASSGVFVLALLIVGLDAAATTPRGRVAGRRFLRWGAPAVAALIVLGMLTQFQVEPRVLSGDRWPTQEALEDKCAVRADDAVLSIAISPVRPMGRWKVELPCDGVDDDYLLRYPSSSAN